MSGEIEGYILIFFFIWILIFVLIFFLKWIIEFIYMYIECVFVFKKKLELIVCVIRLDYFEDC